MKPTVVSPIELTQPQHCQSRDLTMKQENIKRRRRTSVNMDLNNCQDGKVNINLMGCKGKKFSWIVANKPDIIVWAQRKLPECSTDLFRLVQYEEYQRVLMSTKPLRLRTFENKWIKLREAHHAHMRKAQGQLCGSRMTPTNANGCVLTFNQYAFT